MRKKGYNNGMKATALFLAALLVTETLAPTVAYAVSSGPTQSEFNGFTSSDSSEMVDLSTGDFKYDIPLITVPGPEGGYPLVLSYNAGAGMHDEASWVGLGWSLNPGVINRQMRGLPDDFNGDNGDRVTKVNHIRDNMNIALSASADLIPPIPELYGFDLNLVAGGLSLPQSITMYYNTFKGLGFRMGMGAGISALNSEFSSSNVAASVNLTMDSNEGAELQGNVSAGAALTTANAGFTYNARGGVTSVSKGLTMQLPFIPKPFYKAGGNFSTASHVPDVAVPMRGGSGALTIDMEGGAFGTHLNLPIRIEGSVAYMKVHKPEQVFRPYGYLYTHLRDESGDENKLMDYNRDNDVPINMKLPSLPVPVLTNDIYTLKGVGGGGIFRAFRNDAGIYYQPDTYTKNGGATVGLEVAAAAGFKAAVDISGYYASSYSGKWRSDFDNLTDKFKKAADRPLAGDNPAPRRAFYFRMLGEKTPFRNKALYDQFDKNQPAHIGIKYVNAAQEELDPEAMADYEGDYPFSGMQKFKTGIANLMNGKPIPLFERMAREKSTALVEYRTAREVVQAGSAFSIYNSENVLKAPLATNNIKTYGTEPFSYTGSHIQDNHIAEFSVLQTDGSRYYYGIPAYNRYQKENVFGTTGGSGAGNDAVSGIITTYADGMASYTTNNSREKFVSSNELTPYANAYLLTNIVSADYVDVTGNGPTADDYGNYTKFGYHRLTDAFKWRIPNTKEMNTAISAKNYLSVAYDNKGSYTYGTKEIWYLQTVETKTHIAFFITSQRLDGHQAAGEHGGIDESNVAEKNLRKLDKIILFSKKELEKEYPKALQTVDLEYSYDLCPGVPTNRGGNAGTHPDGGGDGNAKKGKLTLERVTITNQESRKGKLAPYTFDYGSSAADNPAYAYGNTDRWGTYRPDNENIAGYNTDFGYRNDYNPYVLQAEAHKSRLDEQAGAWNLKAIHTPSGSTINIQYECDDYAYVQDKPAQQMMRIVGTGRADNNSNSYAGSDNVFFGGSGSKLPIRQNFRRIYFKPEKPITGNTSADKNAQIAQYVNNLPNGMVYFKVNERLQIPKESATATDYVSDYVTGYTKVESYGYIENGTEVIPYIVIPEVDQKGKNPLRVAGLQYLRYKRADLSMTTPGSLQNVAEAILGAIPLFFSSLELIFGYYNWAIMKGHCEYIAADKPSFIRLNSPDGIKYGGGHRVKKISVNDGWNDLSEGDEASQSYEQNFVYRTERKGTSISSGVAAYEPVAGGDENAMKYPHFYNPDNKLIHNDPAFFMEDPLPESYYPAPQVGYARVTVYTTATETVKKSGSGIAVHEFYTAKDYPTLSKASEPEKTDDNQSAMIPFIAAIQFRNLGYSQGYSVEVNDMHGKPKANYTYDSDNWDIAKKDVPDKSRYLTFKKYVYNRVSPAGLTSTEGVSWPEDYPVLANDLPATEPGALGMDFELFGELRENSEFSLSGGAQVNGGVDAAPYMWFIALMPYFEYAETGARTVTTNKIVYRTGILTEVISYNEGNIERTQHIAFDKETGDPVLSITTSDFDDQNTNAYNKPTYSYDMPAHWYHSGMGGAYGNYRLEARLPLNASSAFEIAGADNYFHVGDELYCPNFPANSKHLWVTAVTATGATVAKADGSALSFSGGPHDLVVLRSGKRNLQDAVAGNIVSTRPPNGPGLAPLFDAYNQAATNSSTNWGLSPFSFQDCFNPETVHNGGIVYSHNSATGTNRISYRFYSCSGAVHIVWPSNTAPQNIRLSAGPTNGTVYVTDITNGNSVLVEMQFDGDVANCGLRCLDGVLDASAVEYRNTHVYDASDLPAPGLNDYASGKKGIYRVARTNAYFAMRKQSTGSNRNYTFTGEDGTYDRFVKFDFAAGNANNTQKAVGWRWASLIPEYAYTRDGKVLQSKNPLGIITANLYGYDRNLVTATAVNASHREIGVEDFELRNTGTYSASGRLPLGSEYTLGVVNETAHTGNHCLRINGSYDFLPISSIAINLPFVSSVDDNSTYGDGSSTIKLQHGKKYVLSFWVKAPALASTNGTLVGLNGTWISGADFNAAAQTVDGWRRVEAAFTVPASGSSGSLSIVSFALTSYIDDIRIHPFNSEMKTMVYDPVKYVPTAELDGRNYATFYVYDEEGKPVATKRETERGIYTVTHTRNHINR